MLRALRAAGRELESAPRASGSTGGRAGWAAVLGECQRLMNAAAALQDEAVVALAAIEPVELDDGTEAETHRPVGHVSLDASAIVSGALTVSAVHAERRVRAAVRLAADGVSGSDTETGLGGLHEAMRRGELDAYRASVVADELELAPPEVAAAVVDLLGGHLHTDTAPQLRSRCRRVLATVSPDLVRQRAVRARERCGLRRWAEEPGVDAWEGTFPSEEAAVAWAAIDARAQQLVAAGKCFTIDRARSQALLDLVTGSATIQTVVTLTVPAPPDGPIPPEPPRSGPSPQAPPSAGPSPQGPASPGSPGSPYDLVEVSIGPRGERALVSRTFVERVVSDTGSSGAVRRPCHPGSGALLDDRTSPSYRPPPALAVLVRQRDGRCRFPGCHVSARFCDLDHVRPWPLGPTAARNLICLCRRHHRVKQRLGWRLRLHPDATVTWFDPTGRARTTRPVDALTALVLPAPVAPVAEGAADGSVGTGSSARAPSTEFSRVEHVLEHALTGVTRDELARRAALRHLRSRASGARLRLEFRHPTQMPSGRRDLVVAGTRAPATGHRTGARPRRRGPDDDPPF